MGRRISIAHTRALLAAALGGTLEGAEFRKDAYFGLQVPVSVPGVPDEVLDPSKAWADAGAYAAAARALVARFTTNFGAFAGSVGEDVKAAGSGRSEPPVTGNRVATVKALG